MPWIVRKVLQSFIIQRNPNLIKSMIKVPQQTAGADSLVSEMNDWDDC